MKEKEAIKLDNIEKSQEVKKNQALKKDIAKGQWYIIQCYSQHEYKVRDAIERLVIEENLSDRIFRILIPEEETIEIKNNKRKERITKIFPGYVFINMLVDDQIYYHLRKVSGVSKFVGAKNQPTPVTEDEILKVLRKVDAEAPKIDVDFEIGEVIKVVSGPFRGYTGPISEISAEKGLLKVMLSVFGRETPVSLSFDQAEKAVK
ncbi:transcription termination/antitermination protein NusG [Candidatus Margulisiibacteriota bacterium]